MGERAGKHLGAAAELHGKEWDAIMSQHDHMPWSGETGGHLVEATSRENREALARGVLEAKELYGQAIERIERTLEVEGHQNLV